MNLITPAVDSYVPSERWLRIFHRCSQRLCENDLLFARPCVDSRRAGRSRIGLIRRVQLSNHDLALLRSPGCAEREDVRYF